MRARPQRSGGPGCRRRSHLCAHPRLLGPLLVTALDSRPPQPRGTAAPSVRPRQAALRPRAASSRGSGLPSRGPGGAGRGWGRASDFCGRQVDCLDLLVMSGRWQCLPSLVSKRKHGVLFWEWDRGVDLCAIDSCFLPRGARGEPPRAKCTSGRAPCEAAGEGHCLETLCLVEAEAARGSARRLRAPKGEQKASLAGSVPVAVAEAVARPRPLAGGLR